MRLAEGCCGCMRITAAENLYLFRTTSRRASREGTRNPHAFPMGDWVHGPVHGPARRFPEQMVHDGLRHADKTRFPFTLVSAAISELQARSLLLESGDDEGHR